MCMVYTQGFRLFPHLSRFLFLLFAAAFFFFYIGDSIMSYSTPVRLEQYTHSATMMGLILSLSSMAGIVCDFSFAKFFPDKKSHFFNRLFFSSIFFFPLSFLIAPNAVGFILGMIIWGVYYEAMVFSKYHLIHELIAHNDHAWAWGIFSILQNIAYVIGPVLAALLLDLNENMPFLAALVFFLAGSYWYIGVRFIKKKTVHHQAEPQTSSSPHHSFSTELKIWRTYEKVLWPITVLIILFFLVDSAFYSIGPLFAEELQEFHPFGGLFVSVYSLPGLLTGIFMARLAKPFGKKRLAFTAGIGAGIGLIVMSLVTNVVPILIFTFLASVGLGVLFTALSATMQDFVGRSPQNTNDLIGLSSVAGSIGYVLGPMSNGYLAENFGTQSVFRIWGIVLCVVCFVLLFTVKRKIRLPQSELQILSIEEK